MFLSLYHAAVSWLEGPPLFPDVFTSVSSKEQCLSHGGCYDPIRVMLFSFFWHCFLFGVFLTTLRAFWQRFALLGFNEQLYFADTLVSHCCHLFVYPIAFRAMFLQDISFEKLAGVSSPLLDFSIAFTIGYWAFDLLVIFVWPSAFWSLEILLHHAVTVVVYPFSYAGYAGKVLIGLGLITEISTPFINNRWLLVTMDMRQSTIYVYNWVITAFLYLFFRMGVLLGFIYLLGFKCRQELLTLPFIEIMMLLIGCGTFAFLNIRWFWKVMLGAINAVRRHDSSSRMKFLD